MSADDSPRPLRVACVRTSAGADPLANRARVRQGIEDAAGYGARLLVLGEKWACIGEAATIRAGAEPIDGPSVTMVRELAREHGVAIIAGSLALIGDDGTIRNTSLAIDSRGELCGAYSKLHMFDVEVGGIEYRESAATAPGGEMVVATVDGIRVGLTICYDLRFPELYRALALAGADIITVPAAFTVPTGTAHWETLVRARAIECQLPVLACGLYGDHEAGKRSWGHSLVVDAWGCVRACAGEGDAIACAGLDLAHAREVRRRIPALQHRRQDVYAGPPPGAVQGS